MKLAEAGEFGAIDKVAAIAKGTARGLKVGIGDDAAAFRIGKGHEALVSTDLMVEGIHFDLSFTGFKDLGFKALAANLSDIAAMGGEPLFYLVSIAAPAEMELKDFKRIFLGMEEAGRESGVRLAGGDTCNTPGPLFISVSIIGQVKKGRAVKRSGALPGDGIWVTGTLGDSAAGLEILKSGARGGGLGGVPGVPHRRRRATPFHPAFAGDEAMPERNIRQSARSFLLSRHLRPEARVKAGRLLGKSGIPTSMIDISDGLSSDLRHILNASGTGAVIFKDRLPLSREFAAYAGDRAVSLALSGGEDYELLFTARPSVEGRLVSLGRKAGVPLSKIGEVRKGNRAYLEFEGGKRKALRPEGYEHFGWPEQKLKNA